MHTGRQKLPADVPLLQTRSMHDTLKLLAKATETCDY
jgi:hypothetical protein